MSRNEIMENFVKILQASSDSWWQDNYSEHGESEYTPDLPYGESEWEPSTTPETKEVPEYKYHPQERVYRGPRREDDPLKGRFSKNPKPVVEKEPESTKMPENELLRMIKNEPEHLVSNLMIQRNPEYADFNTIYLLVESLYKWMLEHNINPEPGTILFDESMYMLDLLNKKIDEKHGGA